MRANCEHGISRDECRLIECSSNALSPRESEVAALLSEGLTNKEIGVRLQVSEATVKQHVRAMLAKVRLDNRTELAAWWRGDERPTHKRPWFDAPPLRQVKPRDDMRLVTYLLAALVLVLAWRRS